MFKRLIVKELVEWKGGFSRKPLVLRGARQVGKTVSIRILGETYDFYTELNLELAENKILFTSGFSVHEIVQAIKLKQGIPSDAESWLLFLDEIQSCPEAVAVLRYFYEELPHIHIVAAGSLLEVALQREPISFPVGRVEFLYLHPLCFEEFLGAVANEETQNVFNQVPAPEYAHEQLLSFYHQYALIGGLPEAVAMYAETRDILDVNRVYESLFAAYLDDVSKYAQNRSMTHVLRHCLKTASGQAGSRIRFAGFGESNYGSKEVSEAFRTLEQVMLLSLLYPTTSIEVPLLPNLRKSPRLQFLDIGLVHYLSGVQQELIGIRDLSASFRGRMLEQLTGQELLAYQTRSRRLPLFWVRNKSQSQAELDFLELNGAIPLPVEVKSGAEGKLRSLHLFIEMQPEVNVAVRLYRGVFLDQEVQRYGNHFRLLNIPYYHASKIQEYLTWRENNEK